MTGFVLCCLTLGALLVTGLSAIGVKVLHDFSHHELEIYCRGRGKSTLYNEVISRHDRIALGAEGLQSLAVAVLVLAGGAWLFPALAHDWRHFAVAAGSCLIVLLALTSWLPWAVVEHGSAPFLFHTWRFWLAVHWAMWPLSGGVHVADAVFRRVAGRPQHDDEEEEAFEDEIRAIVNSGMREGLLEEDAREMIEGVIELGDEVVSGIMTPRSEVDAFDISLGWQEVIEFVIRVGRTRIPVYDGSLDNILGVLYAKDLLPEFAKADHSERRSVRQILRDPWFIPATFPVDELLQEFLDTRIHLAIVVDEYRGVSGVVTIEDVIEEIVGEIWDESDDEEDDEFRIIDESVSEVLGRAHLDDVNERLGLALPESDNYDTVAGFVISKLGYIPNAGETVETAGARIVVTKADRRSIHEVRIERVEEAQRESV